MTGLLQDWRLRKPAKILAAVVFSYLAYWVVGLSGTPLALLLAMLWLFLLFPDFLPLILGAGSFFGLIFGARSTGIASFNVRVLDIPSSWKFLSGGEHLAADWPGMLIRTGCACSLILLAWIFLNRAPRWITAWALSLSIGFLFLPLILFDLIKNKNSTVALILLTFAFLWAKMMWSFLLVLKTGLNQPPLKIRQLWLIFPAWNFDFIPSWIPVRPDLLRPERVPKTIGPTIRLLGFSFGLLAVFWLDRMVSFWLYYPPPIGIGLPHLSSTGAIAFLERVPGVGMAWVLIGLGCIHFIMYAIVLCVPFLFLSILDIPAIPSFSRPHLAKSFHEFSSRILSFYVQIVTAVLYAPAVSALGFFLGYGRGRIFGGTFLSVFALGVIYHFTCFLHITAILGLEPAALAFFSGQIAYVFMFSFLTALSVAWGFRRPLRPGRAIHVLRLVLIVMLYGLLLTLAYNPLSESWGWRWRLLRFLFTGER